MASSRQDMSRVPVMPVSPCCSWHRAVHPSGTQFSLSNRKIRLLHYPGGCFPFPFVLFDIHKCYVAQILLIVFCEDGGKICFHVLRVSAFIAGKEKDVVPQ